MANGVSHFDNGNKVFVITGAPGTDKNRFVKQVMKELEKNEVTCGRFQQVPVHTTDIEKASCAGYRVILKEEFEEIKNSEGFVSYREGEKSYGLSRRTLDDVLRFSNAVVLTSIGGVRFIKGDFPDAVVLYCAQPNEMPKVESDSKVTRRRGAAAHAYAANIFAVRAGYNPMQERYIMM